ncbi:hypothetical protein BDA99DRAFT_574925 [Phascolomyces articulosus]|uniref:Uncharacterized protein n=1 Tax=Phascolomyces articulosus TaxID=60185 RepID=A0AAD5PA98_9FUNG|nr:hypothetical protein BDA99DRAFT_574925 [Phascolomyces articulosus]
MFFGTKGIKINLFGMDIPKGFATHIGQMKPAVRPNGNKNFVVRMEPLLKLVAIGKKKIVEDTFEIFSNHEIPLSGATNEESVIPYLDILGLCRINVESAHKGSGANRVPLSVPNILRPTSKFSIFSLFILVLSIHVYQKENLTCPAIQDTSNKTLRCLTLCNISGANNKNRCRILEYLS